MTNKKVKTTPWNKIKAEYLNGVTPKELAVKYETNANTISVKASKENWTKEKEKISKNIIEDVKKSNQEKIDEIAKILLDITPAALKHLKEVLESDESKQYEKTTAAKIIIDKAVDVSGLKTQKLEQIGDQVISVNINRQPIKKISENQK